MLAAEDRLARRRAQIATHPVVIRMKLGVSLLLAIMKDLKPNVQLQHLANDKMEFPTYRLDEE